MNTFMTSFDVSRTMYHEGSSFVGDMAKRLLNNLDNLGVFAENSLNAETHAKVIPFIVALQTFNEVRKSCFGQAVSENYEKCITDFSEAYRSLGISIPLKVHLVESHLSEFIKMKGGEIGAGYYSEQAMESCHKDFKLEWEPNKVREADNDYGRKLLSTIIRYNGKHI